MSQNPEQLLQACRLLFGEGIDLSREFLHYLQPAGVKSAYRARAKEHHPDRFAGQPPDVRRRQTARFQELDRAYRLLNNYLAQRTTVPGPEAAAGGPARPQETGGYPHPRVPPVTLEFGRFLYHRGRITYRELTAALIWQRRQRPNLGSLACRWGWLTMQQVETALRERGVHGRFGTRAVSLGYLNPAQVQVLLRFQRSLQRRLGEYFVEQGLLDTDEVEDLARELQNHNRRIAARSRNRR